MRRKIDDFKRWYRVNLSKLVLFFVIAVMLSLVFIYIPFVNLVLNPAFNIVILIIIWFILFPQSIASLVWVSIVVLILAFIPSLFRIDFIAEYLGGLLYLLLIMIFIRYAKDLFSSSSKIKK